MPTPTHLTPPPTTRHSTTTSVLRAMVLSIAALLVAWPLTFPFALLCAVAGGMTGALSADVLARRQPQLRLPTVLLLTAAVLAVGLLLAKGLVMSGTLAKLLGPLTALHLSQGAHWFVLVACGLFGLRFSVHHRPLLNIVEVVLVAGAVVGSFAAHRDGMVHRPLHIGDWAWSRGVDPVLIFLVLGGLGTLLLAGLMISEDRRWRLPLHFGSLLLVALVLLFFVRVGGLPKPQPAGDLGLTGDPQNQNGGQGEERQEQRRQGGKDSNQLSDLPFQDEYESGGSQAPVAVVLLHDDYSPPPGVYYFRQTVFSQYNGQRLVQSTRDDVDRDVVRRFPTGPTEVPTAPPQSAVRRELRTSIGLLVDHVRPFALDSPASLKPTRNPNPQRFQRAFEVLSHVQTMPYDDMLGRRPGNAEWGDGPWNHYTEAPSDPRYLELAETIIEGVRPEYRSDPLAQALAVKNYLDVNGIYSRKSKHADSGDPAASFLFGDLTGYCVHFAHAATYLFRSRGIPARVAAGYAVAETSRGNSSSILIRGADAHAWPEIYLEGVGWVVVDLSPQQSLDDPWDAADPELQRMLGDMLRQEDWQDEEQAATEPLTLKRVLIWLAILLGVILILAYAIKLYRFLAPRFVAQHQVYRIAYRATLDRLSDAGWVRRYGESREHFARRVAAASPSFETLTHAHLAQALGTQEPATAGQILAWAQAVPRELWRQASAWRRVLGLLNPLSWLWVR